MGYPDALPLLDQQANPHLLVLGDRMAASRVLAYRFAAAADVIVLTTADESRAHTERSVSGCTLDLIDALSGAREGTARLRAAIMAEAGSASLVVGNLLDQLYAPSTVVGHEPARGVKIVPVGFSAAISAEDAAALIADVVDNAAENCLPHPLATTRPSGPLLDARSVRQAVISGSVEAKEIFIYLPVQGPGDWRPYKAAGISPAMTESQRDQVRQLALMELKCGKPHLDDLAAAEIIDARMDELIWEWAIEQASEGIRRPDPIGSRALLQALRDNDETQEVAKRIHASLSGGVPPPRWWHEHGTWIVSTTRCSDLRRAILLEAALEAAAGSDVVANSKAVIIDDDAFLDGPLARAALSHALRAGRKHSLHVVVVANREVPPDIAALCGTWVIDHELRDVLHAQTEVAPDAEPPHAWLVASATRSPSPIARWYTQSEIVHGERVLTGALLSEDTDNA